MSHNTSNLIKQLLAKLEYLHHNELDLIKAAILFARNAHQGQKRLSSEPYINHPLQTALILADLKMDAVSIMAAILHDTIEDTAVTAPELESKFGPNVASLVEGVTKVSHIRLKKTDGTHKSHEQPRQLESLRKLFLAMAKDLRVVIIKLADRLHNMQTLQYVPISKQGRIAEETMDIYVPLANRVGLWQLKSALEDACFKYLYPHDYIKLHAEVAATTSRSQKYIDRVIKTIDKELKKANLRNYEISGRTKNLYGIYQKTIQKHKTLDQIYDIYAVRIITETLKDIYSTLGIIHGLWKPIPGRFKDYIAVPKSNGYQSLHTSVFALDGQKLEIQIRTINMHHHAEHGIASHWLYKEQKKSVKEFNWVKELTKIKNLKVRDFSDELKIDVFQDRIFVYTPKGDVKDLPSGSTPIDFAYSVHSDLGSRLIGAKVNDKIAPLDQKLNNGDIVEILTAKTAHGPKRQWLEIAATNFAKNKIRSFLKKINYDENKSIGKKLINEQLSRLDLPLFDEIKADKIKAILEYVPYKKIDDILVAISQGDISPRRLINKIFPESEIFPTKSEAKPRRHKSSSTVTFGQGQRLPYKLSTTCCTPKPSDQIIGYITRGRGITVHQLNCKNVNNKEPNRLIIAQWEKTKKYKHYVLLGIECEDRIGMLHDITEIIMAAKINLDGLRLMQKQRNYVKLNITVNIKDFDQLTYLIDKIMHIPGVKEVKRLIKNE
ncbi:MAG: bifunctional (p)ppGpp synthetase/guanosine-3',5'-bis(diphosphate) 3'-pyrophosphohydrolase [Patescibacteria group bacterium]